MYQIEIKHNFETAHRLSLPGAPIKCQSIHGHSWWVTVVLEGLKLDETGMLLEFGQWKRAWRGFLDSTVDHHLVVRAGDKVAAAIRGVQPEARILEVPFDPTTEHLARWLWEQASRILRAIAPERDDLRVARVHVQETRVNAAAYSP